MLLFLLFLRRIFASLWITATCVCANSYTWRNVEIGGGGFVTGVVFHPTEPGLVYARTDVGGVYRLDALTNRWIPLLDEVGGVGNEFQHLGVLSIGLDPSNPDRVYVASGQYGGMESWKLPSRLYRSTDRGATWTYTTPGFKMAGNGEGRGTGERLAVDPLDGRNLVIGTSNAGIWRSHDFGVSWSRVVSFPATLTHLNFLMFAPVAHANPGLNRRLYAGVNTLTGQSFWFSDDLGVSWNEVPNHPGANVSMAMMPLQASFDAAGVMYSTWGNATGPGNYATQYGVWKLSADATQWTAIQPPTGQGFFGGISADASKAGHVVVSTLLRWWPGDELYRSTDGGTTWSAVLRNATRTSGNSPWATPSVHWITDVEIDPHQSERVLFNTGFGLFQTQNLSAAGSARRWVFFNDGLEETVPLGLLSPTAGPPLVSVIGDYTGFRHDHLGRSPARGMLQPTAGSTTSISGAALAPSTMVRQHSSSTLVSRDAGVNWAAFAAVPEPIINGHHRVIPSADGMVWLWCPPNSPAFRSVDQGVTWSVVPSSASLIAAAGTPTMAVLAGAAGVSGATNATGGSARFQLPGALALDRAGVRYVADTANHLIRRIGANGATNTLAGGAGLPGAVDATGTNARFQSPAGIVVDPGRTVFVADTGNHVIRKISPQGEVTTHAGAFGVAGAVDGSGSTARFRAPVGLALTESGDLYVADTGNHVIRKISPAGEVSTVAGLAGSSGTADGVGSNARFQSPRGVAVGPTGDVYVADTDNHTIRVMTAGGGVATVAGQAGLAGAVDGNGRNARFRGPQGISIDASGWVVVADTGNHTIRRISPAAVVSTAAGLAGSAGSANGNGSDARFSQPAGVVVASHGIHFYVADSGNHTIRRGVQHNTLVPIADAADPARFYLWDGAAKRLFTSVTGGESFAVAASNVNSAITAFQAVPDYPGHLWARAEDGGLFRSTNAGATFTKLAAVASAYRLAFGKAKPGATHPAVYIWGKIGSTVGFFRSDDIGVSWTRLNDDRHQFGYQNDLAADPRIYGRVYLATSGRGVVVGDLADPPQGGSVPSQFVYEDGLAAGWENVSPVGTLLDDGDNARRGSAAVAVPGGASAGFAVTCDHRSLEGIAALAFWLESADVSRLQLQVGVSRGGISLEAIPISLAGVNGWQRVVVPLTLLGVERIPDLSGLRIESRSVNGMPPAAFRLDDVEWISTDAYQGIRQATITLGDLAHTYDGRAKVATATTSPAGLPVRLSYNGMTEPPVAAGTYTVSATIDDPSVIGTTSGQMVISRAAATIAISQTSVLADGAPKSPAVATEPPNLPVVLTFNGAPQVPSRAGSYAVTATIDDPNHMGSASSTFTILQPALPPTAITGWTSNIAGKVSVSPERPDSPLLNPNDTSDAFSTNTLQADFTPITLVRPGDQVTLTGSFQLTSPVAEGTTNWFRFGLYDRSGQPSTSVTTWLGLTGMANSLWERTGTGLFSTGAGATSRPPDATPAPVSLPLAAGNPPIAFQITATRTDSGVRFFYQLIRTDTQALLLAYHYSDSTPHNNGILGTAQATPNGYAPSFTTAGFAFARSYIGTSGAQAQFRDVRIAFQPAVVAAPQTIAFPAIPNQDYGVEPVRLLATASSGLPVAYEVISGPAFVQDGLLTLTGVGDVTLRASQGGNSAFLPAEPVVQTFHVAKGTAAIMLTDLTQTADGAAKPIGVVTTPANLAVDIRYDGSETPPTEPGSYDVSVVVVSDVYQGTAAGILQLVPAASPLELWREQYFGSRDAAGSAADGADPDGDGLSNLLEFAAGFDPLHSSPPVTTLRATTSGMEFVYSRATAAHPWLAWSVEWSQTLGADGWLVADGLEVVVQPSSDVGREWVVVRLPADVPRRYVRLRVHRLSP